VIIVFTGSIEAENITTYKYVAMDETGQQIDEESIERTYSDSDVKEVYNRYIRNFLVINNFF